MSLGEGPDYDGCSSAVSTHLLALKTGPMPPERAKSSQDPHEARVEEACSPLNIRDLNLRSSSGSSASYAKVRRKATR